jgi:hypothetical protein
MNLQLDHSVATSTDKRTKFWADNRVWWVNCLAIERYWFYAGNDARVARGRRDAMLAELIENW